MTEPNTSHLYRFYRLLVLPAILWYLWVAHYAVTAPMGETIVYERWAILVNVLVAAPVSMIIGLSIMRRLPGNVIGPALIVYACMITSEAIFPLVMPSAQGSLNEFILWTVMFPTDLVLLAHFPTGTVHPRRIVPVIYLFALLMVISGFAILLGGPHSYGSDFAYGELRANPFLIDALEPIGSVIQQDVSDPLLFVATLGPALVLFYRYFHSTPIERKQIRWLLVGFLLPATVLPLPVMIDVTDIVILSASLGLILASFAMPLAIGIGILFYRLWDIDVIIRRTFTYSIISLILVGSYLLIVLASQTVLSTFIDSESSLVVVISTLGVAVLFNPVRERVQRFIDRLFNRKRYDAEATLEAFRDNIRDAIEPDAIQGHLVQTISSTVQPTTISFWGIERQP